MKRALVTCILAVSMVLFAQQSSEILVIDRVTIIDGTGGLPLRNGAIAIENGRIQQIGRRGDIRGGRGVTVIDASGKWVIPGLIDTHIHFDQSASIFTRPDAVDVREVRDYETELAWTRERLPVTLMRYMASGITGVVDMGGPSWTYEVRQMAANTPNAPRVALAGLLISTYAVPELETSDPAIVQVNSPEQARELVARQAEQRPDLVKILFISNPGDDINRQTAIVEAAIAESRSRGFRVAVHATELDLAKIAVRAGASVLVHSISDRRVDREFVDLATSRNVLYIPTFLVTEGYDEVFGQTVNLTDVERRLGDPVVIESWSELSKIPSSRIPSGIPSPNLRATRPTEFANLQLLETAGVRIAAGSDAGNIGTLHGPALHREFELMAEAGMRPMDILFAATMNAAAVMGREAEVGTLQRGKLADLVILDADPTVDIRNARRIYKVMKNGAFVDILPEALR